ncbi:MAG: TnsA endonuclease C-terminal domain-containing protein, partial [Chloroflexota bacterium]
MARNKRGSTPASVSKMLTEGRGKGEGKDYLPWTDITDNPSNDLSSRVLGWKTGRVHQLKDTGELKGFYIFEWSTHVIDIREHYPLSLDATSEIAEQNGIPHPIHADTGHLQVLTTDFYLTEQRHLQTTYSALNFRRRKDINKSAAQYWEMAEIERLYWLSKNIDLKLVSESEIPPIVARNIEIVHDDYRLEPSEFGWMEDDLQRLITVLTEEARQSNLALRTVAGRCDDKLGFKRGSSLRVAYHLIARRKWLVDMNTAIDPGKPV